MPITDAEKAAIRKLVYSNGWETFPAALEPYLKALTYAGTLSRQRVNGNPQYQIREDTGTALLDDHDSYGERPRLPLLTRRETIRLLVDPESVEREARENLRRIRKH